MIALSQHPHAKRGIARAKAWGGLAGFFLVLAAGLMADVALATALTRALVGGIVAYLVVWTAAVAMWRQLLRARARAAVARMAERNRAA
jgi:hypothetical protein